MYLKCNSYKSATEQLINGRSVYNAGLGFDPYGVLANFFIFLHQHESHSITDGLKFESFHPAQILEPDRIESFPR
jgi:hypothetical protein